MRQRPVIPFSNPDYSISCFLFKISESFSEWENKSGLYFFTILKKKEGKPYFKVVYIGSTLNFSNVKYTAGKSIMRHKPTHICFYPSNDNESIRDMVKSFVAYYKPLVKGADVVSIREG